MRKRFSIFAIMVFAAAVLFAGCAQKQVKTEAVAEEPAPAPAPVVEEAPPPPPVVEAPPAPIKLAAAVYFDFDRHTIRTDAVTALRNNADMMKADGGAKIVIEGHCDERGTDEYNMALGERRARAVKDYLVTLGVDSGRIEIISYGNEKPFCARHTEQCWQENRQAHFRRAD